MGIYLGVIFIVSIIGIITFYNGTTKTKKKIFLILSGTIMFLVMALRDERVGTDTQLYCTIFKKIANTNDIFNVSEASTLYAIYNKMIFLIFGLNSQWLIICNSFAIILLVCIFIYKNSDNVAMSMLYFMLFYHYFQAFNISRQFISILLVANSIYFINRKKIKGFLLLSLIAILIHNTAIIFLPIGLILFLNLDLKKILKISVLMTGILYFYDSIINLFLMIFPRYSMYFRGSELFYNTGEGKRIIITLLYLVIVIMAMVLVKTKKGKYDKNNEEKLENEENIEHIEIKKWFNLLFLMIVAIVCGFMSMKSIFINRIELYFSIFAILFIPYFVERFKQQKYFIYMVSVFVLMIPTYVLLSGNVAEIVPYTLFFKT